MNYFIGIISSNKAKNDIDKIVENLSFINLSPLYKGSDMFSRLVIKLYGLFRILTKLKRGDMLLLQYPMKKFYWISCVFAQVKGAKVVAIIHDLGSFRRHKLTPESENRRLSRTDFLIVHNEKMKQYLIGYGCRVKLYCLDIFDYLSEATPKDNQAPHTPWLVIYAGGLGRWRNAFLYELDQYIHNWSLAIYGNGFETKFAKKWRHVHYHGFLNFEEFITHVEGDFGLVWDGNSIDECDGDWGEYLKINNPHKTSFYLRCGIPVIVWKKAAMASFVEQNGVGLCVNSLADIDNVLAALTKEEYYNMRQKAFSIGRKLGNGYFTERALMEAISCFSK